MIFDQDTGDQVHCRLAFAPRPEGPWRPIEGNSIIDAPDFLPLGRPGAFDSHVIFAGARPFQHDGDGATWIYYMGGNGPHDGARKSSLGLATLRPDGWAYVSGQGTFITPSLTVTAELLTTTADFGPGGGALRIGVLPDNATEPPLELSLNNSVPLHSNKTDVAMLWLDHHGRSPDLASLLGKSVKLEVALEGAAVLYTVGFARRHVPS
mmetsp:Transcript_14748/g.33079  ORF Transcript_14748/g.33079 Transcript_14748/m.33079 type:complete len:209 (-) Transcript_14748:195-821(-)